ncbi:MAG: response regulator, partial [Bdellovibrionales bacterium]
MINKNEIKILIVDDEAPICGMLSASLSDEGYKTSTAFDGASALAALSEFRPHIVLLDIWMPGEIDGIEVLRRAKQLYPNVQFLMMSGHGTIET